jgi:hypothetical protein
MPTGPGKQTALGEPRLAYEMVYEMAYENKV